MAAAAGRRDGLAHIHLRTSFGIVTADARIRDTRPATSQQLAASAETVAGFDGRLDNRRELADACGLRIPGPDDTLTDAALVLAAYDRWGDEFAARLNGDFAVAVFDAKHERLLLARDVMSGRSLYYALTPNALLFATKIKSLLADPDVPAVPDDNALAQLVLENWCDDRRTCFEGIFSIPAGFVMIRTRERQQQRPHWSFDARRTIRYRSFDEYCEQFRSLFAEAVGRRLRGAGPVSVAVSGGVDSSSILCQAAALAGGPPRVDLRGITQTFPADVTADESEFLGHVERASGVPIVKIPVSAYRFLEDAEATTRQLECPGLVLHADLEMFEIAQRSGVRTMLSGVFGDQMLADRGYLVDLVKAGRWRKVRQDVRQFAAWMSDEEPELFVRDLWSRLVRELPPRWMFRLAKASLGPWRERTRYAPWFRPEFRQRAAALSRARERAAPRFPSQHVKQYLRHLTAGHYVHAVRCERAIGEMYGIDVSYPFRDRDLVSFLMAIPGEVVNRGGVPKGLLRHALAGIVPESILTRRSKADFTAIEIESLRGGHGALAAMVPPDCRAIADGFVDGDVLQRSLPAFADRADGGETPPGWRLTDVVGLELWLRTFIADWRTGAPQS